MRHRIIGNVKTVGGNSTPEIMVNELTGNETFDAACRSIFDEILASYFTDFGGFDYSAKLTARGFELLCGIEPAYQHDELCILTFKRNKAMCAIREGHARGAWGSAITSRSTRYNEADEKFRRLVDFVHPVLVSAYDKARDGEKTR